jgi:hypothetical protein
MKSLAGFGAHPVSYSMNVDLIFQVGGREGSGRDLDDSGLQFTPPYVLIAWTGRNLFLKRLEKISESDC